MDIIEASKIIHEGILTTDTGYKIGKNNNIILFYFSMFL